MGQVLHGCATTTHAVRKAMQQSKASLKEVSRTYGINPKTVQKRRRRQTVEDQKTGPRQPCARRFSARLKKPSPRPCAVTPRRRSTTASMPSNPRRRISHPFVPASPPATSRHQPSTASRRRQTRQEALQAPPHRLFPRRQGRVAHRCGQT